MAEKLDPCPDCDSRELTIVRDAASAGLAVACTLCESRGPCRKTAAAARRIWNILSRRMSASAIEQVWERYGCRIEPQRPMGYLVFDDQGREIGLAMSPYGAEQIARSRFNQASVAGERA